MKKALFLLLLLGLVAGGNRVTASGPSTLNAGPGSTQISGTRMRDYNEILRNANNPRIGKVVGTVSKVKPEPTERVDAPEKKEPKKEKKDKEKKGFPWAHVWGSILLAIVGGWILSNRKRKKGKKGDDDDKTEEKPKSPEPTPPTSPDKGDDGKTEEKTKSPAPKPSPDKGEGERTPEPGIVDAEFTVVREELPRPRQEGTALNGREQKALGSGDEYWNSIRRPTPQPRLPRSGTGTNFRIKHPKSVRRASY